MGTIPIGHNLEWTHSQTDTIPNGHYSYPNGHHSYFNGHDPEWTQQTEMSTYISV